MTTMTAAPRVWSSTPTVSVDAMQYMCIVMLNQMQVLYWAWWQQHTHAAACDALLLVAQQQRPCM
jgi:hypothetical protein